MEEQSALASTSAIQQQGHEQVKRLMELMNPTLATSSLLYSRIDEEMYRNETDLETRKQLLAEEGYDSNYLLSIGQVVQGKSVEYLKKMDAVAVEERPIAEMLIGLALSRNNDGSEVKYHPLSVGLGYEMVRQGRKLIKALIEPDKQKRQEILAHEKIDIFEADCAQLPSLFAPERDAEMSERINTIFSEMITTEERKRQYRAVLRMLQIEIRK